MIPAPRAYPHPTNSRKESSSRCQFQSHEWLKYTISLRPSLPCPSLSQLSTSLLLYSSFLSPLPLLTISTSFLPTLPSFPCCPSFQPLSTSSSSHTQHKKLTLDESGAEIVQFTPVPKEGKAAAASHESPLNPHIHRFPTQIRLHVDTDTHTDTMHCM